MVEGLLILLKIVSYDLEYPILLAPRPFSLYFWLFENLKFALLPTLYIFGL